MLVRQDFLATFFQKGFVVALFLCASLLSGCQQSDPEPSDSPLPTLSAENFAPIGGGEIEDLDALPQTHAVAELAGISMSTLPNKTNSIGSEAPIEITFDKPMDRKSVETALVIEPAVPGELIWQANTASFRPEQPYTAGQTYRVSLGSNALDAEGNNLPEQFERTFTVDDELQILAIVPRDQEVSTDTDISIIFNQPIAELSTIDELAEVDFGIEVSPQFPFRYRLAGTSTLQIQGQMPADGFNDGITLTEAEDVEHRLPRSSQLRFTIPADFTALNGSTLGEAISFTVNTPRIELHSTFLPNNISPFSFQTLSFSQPVRITDVVAATAITSASDTPVEVEFNYAVRQDGSEDRTRVTMMPLSGFWGYGEQYQVSVASDITGAEGNLSTETRMKHGFSTRPIALIASPQADEVGPNDDIIVKLDQPPVSLAGLRQALAISEIPSFEVAYVQICKDPLQRNPKYFDTCEKVDDRRRVRISFAEPLENEKTYAIEIAAGLPLVIEEYDSLYQDGVGRVRSNGETSGISSEWLGKRWQTPEAINLPFTVVPKPQVIGFEGKNSNYREFCFYTNVPFAAESVEEFFMTEPAIPNLDMLHVNIGKVPGQIVDHGDDVYYGCNIPGHEKQDYIHIQTGLDFEAEYALTIPAGTKDAYGQELSTDYVVEHVTGALNDEDIQVSNVSEYMAITPIKGMPKAVFRTMNLPGDLQIDICRLDIRDIIRRQNELYKNYNDAKWIPDANTCDDFRQISISTVDDPWQEQFLEVPLKEVYGDDFGFGTYIVAAHHPRVQDTVWNRSKEASVTRYTPSILQVTDIALITKTDSNQVTAWASRMSDGRSIGDVEIVAAGMEYAVFGKTVKLSDQSLGKTDAGGLLQAELQETTKPYSYLFAIAPDGDMVMLESYGNQRFSREESWLKAYIFTDRPIYRPGDTVNGKATFAYDEDAVFEPAAEREFVLSAYDRKQQMIVEDIAFRTNALGSTEFNFVLPADVSLGDVQLHFCVSAEAGPCFFESFTVEEYKKPEFETDVTAGQEDYFADDEAEITVTAEYFFGLPVADGAVRYSLKRDRYVYDRYTAESGYRFAEGEDFFPWTLYRRGGIWPPYRQTEYLKDESATLDAEGTANFTESIDLPSNAENKTDIEDPHAILIPFEPVRLSQKYTAEVTVADHNENPIFGSNSFIALATDRFVGIKTDAWSTKAGDTFTIQTVVADATGEAQSEETVSLSIIREEQVKDETEQTSSRYGYDTYHVEEEVLDTTKLTTNETGKASFEFTPTAEQTGRLKLVAEVTDSVGRLHRSSTTLFVYDSSPSNIDPQDAARIELIPDKTEYQVGDVASITVLSPLDNAKTNYFLSQERQTMHQVSLVQIPSIPVLDFPVTEEMIPNMHLSIIGQEFGDDPRMANGTIEIVVNTEPKDIGLTVATDAESYQPGATVTLEIEAANASSEAEVAIVVVDKANLVLLESKRQAIMDFFWSKRPNFVQSAMTLLKLASKITLEETVQQKARNMVGLGGGVQQEIVLESVQAPMMARDAGMADKAAFSGEATDDGAAVKTRTQFKDTAFFEAIVPLTNRQAEVAFTLPDNITTWEVLAIAHDDEFNVGEATQSIIAKRPLLLRPQVPRFVRFGDEVEIRADITNDTEADLEAMVALAGVNIAITDDMEFTLEIAAGETATAVWTVSTDESEIGTDATFTFTASSDSYADAIEQTIPVLSYATPETVATSGVTTGLSHYEKIRLPESVVPNLGGLTISTSATLANYLHSGLNSIVEYPYGSNEVSANKLLALTIYRRAMLIPNFDGHLPAPKLKDEYGNEILYDEAMRHLIDNIEKNQRADGGWGYWKQSREANFSLTAQILAALAELKQDGISFDPNTAERATEYLVDYMVQKRDLGEKGELDTTGEADQRTFVLWTLTRFGAARSEMSRFIDELTEKRDLLSTDGKINFVLLLQNTAQQSDVKDEVFAELTALLEVDPRGMFLSSGQSGYYWSYSRSTAEQRTARFIKALVQEEEGILQEDPFIPKMLAWLIRSRKDGTWGSNYTTVAVLDAFVDFLKKSKEYDADFVATLFADGREVQKYPVNDKTLFDTHQVNISTQDVVERGEEGLVVQFLKEGSEAGALYYDIAMRYFLPIAEITAREEGITVKRNYYATEDSTEAVPLENAEIGDVLKGKIMVTVPDDRRFVVVDSPLPAGMELINFRLKTSDQTLLHPKEKPDSMPALMMDRSGFDRSRPLAYDPPYWPSWNAWTHTEMRDDRLLLYADRLNPGVYEYEFFVRVTHAGEFAQPPAHAEEMETPENFGRTEGSVFVSTD